METTSKINEFINELEEMEINPVLGNDQINLEFYTKDIDLKRWKEITDEYIGSWKKMRMGINHDIPKKLLRFTIPFNIIGGEDYTFEQMVVLANEISKRI